MTKTEPATDHLADMLEMLEAWLSMHRRSPLDGTTSCGLCRAMVLDENGTAHALWHQRLAAGVPDDRQTCKGCHHLLSVHGLRVSDDGVNGPFSGVCNDCPCIIWGLEGFRERVIG
jgi:hypothetical protein